MLNSGGIDSRVAAAMLHEQGHELHSLRIDFGNGVPFAPVKRTADLYCVGHTELVWPGHWTPVIRSDGQARPAYAPIIPHALGLCMTEPLRCSAVASGWRRDNRNGGDAVTEGMAAVMSGFKPFPPVQYLTPLWGMTPRGVVRMAERMGVDLSDTWSCWTYPACGECHSCKERAGRWQH